MEQAIVSSHLEKLELNALLEVTQAINNNLPEDDLYKIYKFTLLADFNVKKLALYVLDNQWQCKVNFGVGHDFCKNHLPHHFADLTTPTKLTTKDNDFSKFDFVIPVLHKTRLLALVFVGDLKSNIDRKNLSSETTFLEALTNIVLVAIENKKLAKQQLEQEAYKKEMEIASQVQQYLFPDKLPSTDKLAMAATYLPHRDVGGDYYDHLPIDDDKCIICIADVSGKGVPAALMMSNFQASLHTLVRKTVDLKEIVEDLNLQIKFSGNGEIFITFFIAMYDAKEKMLNYINCGHNPPIVRFHDGSTVLLDQGTTVLGMFSPLPFNSMGTLSGASNFTLFCYTDGLSESNNLKDEEFGSERIEKIVAELTNQNPKELNSAMMKAVNEFRQEVDFRDDVTLLTCRML